MTNAFLLTCTVGKVAAWRHDKLVDMVVPWAGFDMDGLGLNPTAYPSEAGTHRTLDHLDTHTHKSTQKHTHTHKSTQIIMHKSTHTNTHTKAQK